MKPPLRIRALLKMSWIYAVFVLFILLSLVPRVLEAQAWTRR